MITNLFVYGTLQPGDVRWHYLAPFAADEGEVDSATGQLFDTGRGYPAATFGGEALIHGRVYALRAERVDEAFVLLDEVEAAVEGLYKRVEITTNNGRHAWAYAYGDGLELTPIPSGRWTINEP